MQKVEINEGLLISLEIIATGALKGLRSCRARF